MSLSTPKIFCPNDHTECQSAMLMSQGSGWRSLWWAGHRSSWLGPGNSLWPRSHRTVGMSYRLYHQFKCHRDRKLTGIDLCVVRRVWPPLSTPCLMLLNVKISVEVAEVGTLTVIKCFKKKLMQQCYSLKFTVFIKKLKEFRIKTCFKRWFLTTLIEQHVPLLICSVKICYQIPTMYNGNPNKCLFNIEVKKLASKKLKVSIFPNYRSRLII